MKQKDLAKILGITPSAIGNYESGTSTPRADILFKVFDALQCDANYLFQDETKNLSGELILSARERQLILKYRSLPGTFQNSIDSIVDATCDHIILINTDNT